MFVVTGATGFVGAQIVPALREHGEVIVISRDPDKARALFPGIEAHSYDALDSLELVGACIIHLAVRNNDGPGSPAEFRAANVDCLMEVAKAVRERGAVRLLNLCSTHALVATADDLYGASKREGARQLAAYWPEAAANIYVPAIYGAEFQGKLRPLNRLPRAARPLALALLRQLRASIAIDVLFTQLLRFANDTNDVSDAWKTERYLADPVPPRGLYSALKRSFDIGLALAILVGAGWAMLLIALYVRFDSPGSAIFAQTRVGRGGRQFTCYKFRTMQVGTKSLATHDVSASAITKAGNFLRRTKLDELPQLFNVLANDMSFVGPRPCLPVQEELIARRAARGVLDFKPGITGLAQINDIDMSDPPRLAAWDDRYRAFRSTISDLSIMVKTLLGRGSGDRVVAAPEQIG